MGLIDNIEVDGNHNYFVVSASNSKDGYLVHNKLVFGGTTPPTVTKYIGGLYEETNGRKTKHIYFGDMKVASVTGGHIRYHHADHLGGANVLSNNLGEKVELVEYEPFGKFSRQEKYGSTEDVARFYFTGQRYDDDTELYYYNARYYDPGLGRFISADTVVQAPDNPQTLNRYAYAGNNPVNNVDPSGHSFWKKLWGGIKAVAKVFFNFQVPGLGDGIVDGSFAKFGREATTIGISALFSWGNPVAITSSYLTSKFFDTKQGRKLTDWIANEIYDDAFGFHPSTAKVLAAIDLSATTSFMIERSLAHIVAETGKVVNFDPNNSTHMDLIQGDKYGYHTYGGPPDSTNPEAASNWVAAGKLKVLEGKSGNLALAGEKPYLFGSVHTGANSPNFPQALNMKYPSSLPRNLQGLTFGWCHQATNATLLVSGFNNVVTETSGNVSTYMTTFMYGNYGGGLVQKGYNVYQTQRNLKQGR